MTSRSAKRRSAGPPCCRCSEPAWRSCSRSSTRSSASSAPHSCWPSRRLEGVALGAISKFFDASFGDGIVSQAVLGTFAAFAGTLAAYKFFDIKVGNKFRTFVIAGMFGVVGLGILSLVLSFFGIDTGLFGFGTLGLVMAIVGLTLGVFMLILDFDFVENGVAAGLPEHESWRAAFGLTVSLVWIYTNLLRILAILRGD
ncbi:MAG: Bax inhibitor-1/YccA family protein [Nocardioides sp.]